MLGSLKELLERKTGENDLAELIETYLVPILGELFLVVLTRFLSRHWGN